MSGKKERKRSGLRRRTVPPQSGKVKTLKIARSSKPSSFLPARYGAQFPPDAVMDHRVILEIPAWTRRKLDKWLGNLKVNKGIESAVDLSTNDRDDLPFLSRPIISAPGREFEMILGSVPTSPQLVDDASPNPPTEPSTTGIPSEQSVHKEPPFVDSVVVPNLCDIPPVFTVSSSETDPWVGVFYLSLVLELLAPFILFSFSSFISSVMF